MQNIYGNPEGESPQKVQQPAGTQQSGVSTGAHKQPSERQRQGIRTDQGTGFFPISDLQFDVLSIIHEKSKALKAYTKYLRDSVSTPELLQIFEQIAADDRKHITMLKNHLGNH